MDVWSVIDEIGQVLEDGNGWSPFPFPIDVQEMLRNMSNVFAFCLQKEMV